METKEKTKPKPKIDWLEEAWATAYLRVKGTGTAQWLWQWVFTPAEQRRLGDDLEKAYTRYQGTAGMWMHLHGLSLPRAVVAVATRCNMIDPDTGRALLRKFGEAPNDPKEVVDWAVKGGGLVLVERPRKAFWDGREIPIDWLTHSRPWFFLWTLAQRSKAGEGVDTYTRGLTRSKDPKYVTKLKHRTVNLDGFPVTLDDRIVNPTVNACRLDLPASQIHVYENTVEEGVREWGP